MWKQIISGFSPEREFQWRIYLMLILLL
jgi:hypothetical protein